MSRRPSCRLRVEALESRLNPAPLDLSPGTVIDPSKITPVGADVFFVGDGYGTNDGYELWKSDGTVAGTRLVRDIRPGPESTPISSMTDVNGRLYFVADDGIHGYELWTSDGTLGGTTMVANLAPSASAFSFPNGVAPDLTVGGGVLYFNADKTGQGSNQLWMVTGPGNAPVEVKTVNPADNSVVSIRDAYQLTDVAGTLFVFSHYPYPGTSDLLLRTSPGSALATAVRNLQNEFGNSYATEVTSANGKLYFVGYESGGFSDRVLWVSNGTGSGTAPIANTPFVPENLTPIASGLLFSAGPHLWVSDGTMFGTKAFLVSPPGVDARWTDFESVGGKAYFLRRPTPSEAYNTTLWVSDGTFEGTNRMVPTGAGMPAQQGDFAVLTSPASTVVYFNSGPYGGDHELWQTDGTAAGTRQITPNNPSHTYGTDPVQLTVAGGKLYYAALRKLFVLTPTTSVANLPRQLLVSGAGGNGLLYTPTGGQYGSSTQVPLIPDVGGELHVALGDVNGDGILDIIAGTGGGDYVKVVSGKDQSVLAAFSAFDGYTGGIFVSVGDLNGDGMADIAVTGDAVDAFSGPVANGLQVRVFDGNSLTGGTKNPTKMADFNGLASLDGASGEGAKVKLGGRPSIADVNGDGKPDLLIAAGSGGGPRVCVWNGTGFANANGGKPTANPIANVFVFESTQRGGAFVTAGDVNGDGKAEIIVGGGPGGGPRVRIVDGAKLLALPNLEGVNLDDPANLSNGLVLNNFFAGSSASRGGVRLTVRDVDGDGRADVVTSSGTNERSQIRVYNATSLQSAFGSSNEPANPQVIDPFGIVLADGIWVG